MLKFNKFVSLLLAALMVISMITVMATAAGAVTYEDTKLYFDASSTGWELGSKDKIGFYVYGPEGELLPWGGKKLNGTDEGDGVWSYDPAAKGMNIEEGKQYAIIFTGAGNQTYDLLFDTTCFGHVAYCDETGYENPVDSSQKARAAFWKDLDATKYGPKLQISSIGTVVGTCPEQGKTPVTIFEDFLTNTLANARTYMVDTGNVTEQELIDNIGEGLGLTKDDIAASIASTGTESVWSADDSTLPAAEVPTEAHTHTPAEAVQENIVPAACNAEGSYDEVVYCTECGEELSREAKTIEKLAHTPGKTVYENEVINHDNTIRDAVVYCTECGEELSRQPVQLPILTHSLDFVDEVPATYEADGVMAHYECRICGELFSDAQGRILVSAAELVIPKLTLGYYVVGNFTDWQYKDEYKMTEGEDGIYTLVTDLTTDSALKIVHVKGEDVTWIPDGMGYDYIVPVNGSYTVYFDSTFTHEGWYYDCITIELITPEPGDRKLGDIDGDGDVTVVDATYIQRFATKVSVPVISDDLMQAYGDVDGDGDVTPVDATLVMRYATLVPVPYKIGEII